MAKTKLKVTINKMALRDTGININEQQVIVS